MADNRTILPLIEYAPARFPPETIPYDLGDALWRGYGSQVKVDFPSPITAGQWQLTSQGWVGYVPLTPELGLALQPRVELGNLFGMLEYAYRLKSFRFLEGLIDCQSLAEFYERLAHILARRVLDRGRKGFYRAYLSETDRLPYVRGRMDIRHRIEQPWDCQLRCHYDEHTADLDENRILAWTLMRVAHSAACTERVLPTVRRAYHALRGFVSLNPYAPEDCVGRLYNRLNDDYHALHALCRFLLEHTGPTHLMGDRAVLPFLVHMPRLYELFVAEWLKEHLPPHLLLKAQEKVELGEGDLLSFNIDLVLYDADTGRPRCVLDTKYKSKDHAEAGDVLQIVAYAQMKGCRHAVLVYPDPLLHPLDHSVRSIRVQTLGFGLKGDLEQSGQAFLRRLLHSISAPSPSQR